MDVGHRLSENRNLMVDTVKAPLKKNGSKNGNGGQVTIREMELDDLPAVYALGERLFTAEKLPSLYRTWDQYELVEFFASDGDNCLVAEVADRIVGFVLGTLIEKRKSAWKYGYLVWIGVDDGVGRRGVGARLLQRLTEIFIEGGARMMLLDTDADNTPALKFFRREGFGHERPHVYLTRNLTSHPEYVRRHPRRESVARRTEAVSEVVHPVEGRPMTTAAIEE